MKKTLIIRVDGGAVVELDGANQDFADQIVLNAQQGWAAGNGFVDFTTGDGINERRLTINSRYIQSVEVKRSYNA